MLDAGELSIGVVAHRRGGAVGAGDGRRASDRIGGEAERGARTGPVGDRRQVACRVIAELQRLAGSEGERNDAPRRVASDRESIAAGDPTRGVAGEGDVGRAAAGAITRGAGQAPVRIVRERVEGTIGEGAQAEIAVRIVAAGLAAQGSGVGALAQAVA